MESMRNRMRGRRLRGLVLHHRRHPSAHPRRLVTRTASWGEPPVRGVCRWCHEHTAAIHLTWHDYCLAAYRVASGQKPLGIQVTMCEGCGGPAAELDHRLAINVARAMGPRRSGERSPWRTSTGSAARATGARPGWTAGSRGSFRTARSTGEEPGGPGDSTAPGRACSSLLSG